MDFWRSSRSSRKWLVASGLLDVAPVAGALEVRHAAGDLFGHAGGDQGSVLVVHRELERDEPGGDVADVFRMRGADFGDRRLLCGRGRRRLAAAAAGNDQCPQADERNPPHARKPN